MEDGLNSGVSAVGGHGAHEGQARENAPGTDQGPRIGEVKPIGKGKELIVHSKAIRRLAAYMLEPIGDRELTSIGIVGLWCDVHERQGGALKDIVNWSGYTRNWKARVHKGIRDSIQIGALEFVKVPGGQRLCMTAKGEKVLKLYEHFYEVVEREMGAKQRKVQHSKAMKELVRSMQREAA